LGVDFATDADGRFSRFSIHQSGAQPGADETRVHRLAVGIYDDDGSGKLVRVHREELDVDGETTDVPALQGVPRENLSLVNDDDLTYGTLRLDPDSLHTVLTRIVDVAEPLPRALVWSATRQMTRNSEMRARDFVGLVIGAVHAETDMSVVQELLASASRALARYAEQSWARAEGWPAYADRLLALARSADAGSDRQLAFVDAGAGRCCHAGTRGCWPSCSTTNRPKWDWPAWRSTPNRYFDEAADIWQRWPGAVGRSIIGWLYPGWAISSEGLSAADAFLAGDTPPALRRLICEGRSEVEHALTARAYDAT
jgi:ERAP1-like C-terminal domain